MTEKLTKIQRTIIVMLLLAITSVYVYQVNYYWHYTNDDAYITFRYSQNLANGFGPYYNMEEHIEGYTNFSLMILMAFLLRYLGPTSAPFIAKLFGAFCGGGTILLTFILFRTLFTPNKYHFSPDIINIGALISAGIVSINPAIALNSTSGLETMMFSFFLVLALVLARIEENKERLMGAALAFSVVILTRPEGILLFGVYWFAHLAVIVLQSIRNESNDKPNSLIKLLFNSKRFRLLLVNVVIVSTVYLLHFAFRYFSYDGEWLPNTFYAKQGGFWATGAWQYISDGLLFPVFGVTGLILSLVGYCLKYERLSLNIFPFAVITLVSGCLPFITGTDWMLGWRFVIPYLPLVAIFTVGGWLFVLATIPKVKIWVFVVILVVALGTLWFNYNAVRKDFYEYTLLRAKGYRTGHKALASWLKNEADKGDIIALMDIGIVGYQCVDQSILDLTGLTDRVIAKSKGTFLRKVYDLNYVLDRRPKFIVLTLTAFGDSYHVPPKGTNFRYWTPLEERLSREKQFQIWYVNKRPYDIGSKDWLDSLASKYGAEKIFEHGHPGKYYLLAVFRRKPDNPPNLYHAAIEAQSAGDYQRSLKYLDACEEIQPGYKEVYFAKGFALQKIKNLTAAIKYYKKHLAVNPKHTQSYFNLAYALMTEGKYREAIRSFEKTLALNPNYREVHLHLANCNEKIGNKAQQARHMALYNSKK